MMEADENPDKDYLTGPKIEAGMKSVKPKRRSLIERELETSLSDRVTSPITCGDVGITSSRYGRTRKPKQELELISSEKCTKTLAADKIFQPNVMTAINEDTNVNSSPSLGNKIVTFVDQNPSRSPDKVLEHKIYVRKDLIQKPEGSAPASSASSKDYKKNTKNSHLNNILERSSEKYDIETSIDYKNDTCEKFKAIPSVVKTLDFDSGKRKKDENRKVLSKSELFELETKCEYQVGDLAWARVGAYPFWPCIVTKDPFSSSGSFVKTKLFGRVERNVIHVTFFGDNGRRGWIIDNMLRKYSGIKEFEATRDNFSSQDKKKDPRFYAAFVISEKQIAKWNVSVQEAETLLREPKRLRIDVLHEMLNQSRDKLKGLTQKSEKITRTDSDVSLSESLYDSLFSEDDTKDDDKTKNKSKKPLDVSEVVTACIDNIAAMSGLPKIHKQSHMDRWLLKAKSKTPEKPTATKSRDKITKKKILPLKDCNLHISKRHTAESRKSQKVENDIKKSGVNSDSDNNIDLTVTTTDEDMCKDGENTSEIGSASEVLSSSDNQREEDDTGLSICKKEASVIKTHGETMDNDEKVSDVDNKHVTIGKEICDELKSNSATDSVSNIVSSEIIPVSSDEKSSTSVENIPLSSESKNASSVNISEPIETAKCIELSSDKPDIENINKQNVSNIQTDNKPISTNCDRKFRKSTESVRSYRNKVNLSLKKTRSKSNKVVENPPTMSNGEVQDHPYITHNNVTDCEENQLSKSINIDTEAKNSSSEAINMNCVKFVEETNESLNYKSQINGNHSPDHRNSNDVKCNGHADELLTNDLEAVDNDDKATIETTDELLNGTNGSIKEERDETDFDSLPKSPEINKMLSDDSYLSSNQSDLITRDEINSISDIKFPIDKLQQEDITKPIESDTENKSQIVSDHQISDNVMQYDIDTKSNNVTNDETSNTSSGTDYSHSNIGVPESGTKIGKLLVMNAKAVVLLDRHVIANYNKGALKYAKLECSEKSPTDDEPLTVFKSDVDGESEDLTTETDANIDTKDKLKRKTKTTTVEDFDNPEFVKYLVQRQDALLDENPHLSVEDMTSYLYKTWVYEEGNKPANQSEIDTTSLVKGLDEPVVQPKKVGRKKKEKVEVEKDYVADKKIADENITKEKPKRRVVKAYYNEDDTDAEEELKYFEMFRKSNKMRTSGSPGVDGVKDEMKSSDDDLDHLQEYDEVERYFEEMVKPKPNVFKGLARERVCEVCEKVGNLIKCKGACAGMFHVECAVKKEIEVFSPATKGRKKKKQRGRKQKSLDDSESQSDEKIDEEENRVYPEEEFELGTAAKLHEMLSEVVDLNDYHSSEEEVDWSSPPGRCDIVDIKLRPKQTDDSQYANFKCSHCAEHDTPLCFVCKRIDSPKSKSASRQRCQVAHCNKYFHIECMDMWPQTQYSGDVKESSGLCCPRHVCHTCVCDDPRGCKTRFSGDKLARCVRCPATYHSFTKCLPAGTTILSASHVICPRHHENRPGKVPCHVNTGWCFICALGGTLICCEYCPTSFHAECLNISPPEGNYMCEDCETGRLPLYGEMVWVKLGHYRWWPGLVLHPCEIPANIMAVKHSPGEFVVRFFGQYDHYWVNRGRVFPFQEGDSGKVSSQKSKIDEAFTTAMEHAQRACELMKTAPPNAEEDGDIAQSLRPPRYTRLRANKPRPPLARRDPGDLSLSACDCDPAAPLPCAPYTQCLNRLLLTECGPACRAGERCQNRAFERREYPELAAYRTPWRGWGLKTLVDIRQGSFVIEYVGELIDEAEFQRRMRRKHDMRDENYYFLTLDKDRMIDAGPKGNLARFMNHSCEPNCETQKWTVLGDVRVGLFALRDIPANTEVTFNYNLECTGIEKKPCLCGARLCSGYIGAKPKQEEVAKKQKPLKARKRGRPTKDKEQAAPKPKTKPRAPRVKPKELTEIEKDLLIIRSATNGISSDSECSIKSLKLDENGKAMKRKRDSLSTDYAPGVPNGKRLKLEEL